MHSGRGVRNKEVKGLSLNRPVQVPGTDDLGRKDTEELVIIDVVEQMIVRGSGTVNDATNGQLNLLAVSGKSVLKRILIGDVDRLDTDVGPHALHGADSLDTLPLGGHQIRILPALSRWQPGTTQKKQMTGSPANQPAGGFKPQSPQSSRDDVDPVCCHHRGMLRLQTQVRLRHAGYMPYAIAPRDLVMLTPSQALRHDVCGIINRGGAFIEVDHPPPQTCLFRMPKEVHSS